MGIKSEYPTLFAVQQRPLTVLLLDDMFKYYPFEVIGCMSHLNEVGSHFGGCFFAFEITPMFNDSVFCLSCGHANVFLATGAGDLIDHTFCITVGKGIQNPWSVSTNRDRLSCFCKMTDAS